MAVTLTEIDRQFIGTQMVKTVDITWDSSYASGGEALSLSQLGMSRIDDIECDEGTSSAGAYITKWDGSKTAPKILVYAPGSQALTDSSGGTASATIAATVGVYTLPIVLPPLVSFGTSAIDLVTDIVLGHAFKVLSWQAITTVAGTGSGASQVLNLAIGAVAGAAVDVGTVPSTLTLTEASTSDVGERTAGTTVTGANTGTAAQALTVELAASGTEFTAGAATLYVVIQNMDTANAFASLVAGASGSEVLAATTNLASPQMTSRIRVRGA